MSSDLIRRGLVRKSAALVMLVGLLFLAAACGSGDSNNAAANASAGSVSAEDVERDLKFDARVDDFNIDGNMLEVNVNEHWMSSPAGMQQTTLKRWLARWQASKTGDGEMPPKDIQVVVRYQGEPILTAAGDGKVEVVAKAKSETGTEEK